MTLLRTRAAFVTRLGYLQPHVLYPALFTAAGIVHALVQVTLKSIQLSKHRKCLGLLGLASDGAIGGKAVDHDRWFMMQIGWWT
jgi:hypothetical protein